MGAAPVSGGGGPLLILGLGNVLCGDDGAGVAALVRLHERYEAPEGVRTMDGGTLGLTLVPYLQAASSAVLLDAVAADAAPGTRVRLEGDDVPPAVEHRLSPHQVGVADLLHAVRLLGGGPRRLVLHGIVPHRIEPGVSLSAVVAAGLDGLVEAAAREAGALGFPLVRRTAQPGTGAPFRGGPAPFPACGAREARTGSAAGSVAPGERRPSRSSVCSGSGRRGPERRSR